MTKSLLIVAHLVGSFVIGIQIGHFGFIGFMGFALMIADIIEKVF